MYAASEPLNRVFTGTSTPPAVVMPSAATSHSSEFGAHTATRSPHPMPDAMSALAASATIATSPVNPTRRSPSTTASASPKRRAASRTMAGIVGHVTSLRAWNPDTRTPVVERTSDPNTGRGPVRSRFASSGYRLLVFAV